MWNVVLKELAVAALFNVVLPVLSKMAAETETDFDDRIIAAIKELRGDKGAQ